MTEFWEQAFVDKHLMWGLEPTQSAVLAADRFLREGVQDVLIPGIGYGRNAKPFIERGMSVTGIEISDTAIALARDELGLDLPIHHGSVLEMPYDTHQYGGIFCYGMIYLLDGPGRTKLIEDCYRQLTAGGQMVFTVIAQSAPMYATGERLGEDWYEIMPGVRMYFYDRGSIEREFESCGLTEISEIDEPSPHGGSLPFINVICAKGPTPATRL